MAADLFGVPAYLAVNLLGTLFALAALAVAGRHRKPMLIAGAIETLHAPFSVFFADVYWQPQRIGGLAFGVEDVILCFWLGAGVWFAAARPLGPRVIYADRAAGAWRRLAKAALLPVPVGLAVWLAGLTTMETLLLLCGGTMLVLAALRPDLLALPARAVPLYTAYYVAFCYLCAWLIPGFFGMWNGPELWGPRLFGLPVDEIAFVVAFTACFPLVVGWVLDVRIAPRAAPAAA